MMREGSHNTIRTVNIHHKTEPITGFQFLDKERALFWQIKWIESWMKIETVLLAENELIVGVVAKLLSGCQSIYTDFQFQIGKN